MDYLFSKLTSKNQAFILKKVSEILKSDFSVSTDVHYLKLLENQLTEWNSEDDEKAYQNL